MNDSDFQGLSRAEAILENMLGATNNLKPPQSRVEALLIRLLELIEDISHGSGTVFRFIGEKEYVNDLPETGNEQGDVWFVKEKMAGYIWIVREDYPDGYWEELGEVIDTASLENIFFPVQYNLTEYADILDAIQSNKIPILIFYPSAVNTQRRLAYFGYNNDSGIHFYELSSDSEITEYLVNNTSPSWKLPRSITLVNSVNGKTGDVTLAAADVGATPETFIVTVTASNGSYSADKTFAEISTAYAAGKRLMASFPVPFNDGYVNALNPLVPAIYGSYVVGFASYIVMSTATGVVQYQLEIDNNDTVFVSETPLQSPYMTATFTIPTTDWNNGSYTKPVTGMTTDALVFIKYSDTETEFTEVQESNALTFTAATTPSEDVTVYVAWFKEVSV